MTIQKAKVVVISGSTDFAVVEADGKTLTLSIAEKLKQWHKNGLRVGEVYEIEYDDERKEITYAKREKNDGESTVFVKSHSVNTGSSNYDPDGARKGMCANNAVQLYIEEFKAGNSKDVDTSRVEELYHDLLKRFK